VTGGRNNPTSNTLPPGTIKVVQHDASNTPSLSTRTIPNGLRPIPLPVFIPPTKTGTSANPYVNSLSPKFELLIHPDYRPPPPKPRAPTTVDYLNWHHSPLDYLPTKTNTLYDLVFAIRRRDNADTSLNLQSLTIEIPVSDNGDKPDPKTHFIREPLLEAGDYSCTGVRMCHNQRFVPALFSGVASSIGSTKWDSKAILGIRLVPRSGRETGTLPLKSDKKAAEASVRVSEARLMGIVDSSTRVLIERGTDPATGKARLDSVPLGRCMVKLTEQYGDSKPDQWSWCAAIKADTGDKDPWGHVI
jgi:hypothetical protein